MTARILVTGFQPFSNHITNISQQVVELISSTEERRYQVESRVLSVDEEGSRETAKRIRSGEKFDAVLHMGFSEDADAILIERFARNRLQMKTPDNSGRMVKSEMICQGDGILETNVEKSQIDFHLEGVIGIRWNNDAGGFVCNETYYRSLFAAYERNSPIVLFVHLPSDEIISIKQQLGPIKKICDALESIVN